jgi:hypothetical protein
MISKEEVIKLLLDKKEKLTKGILDYTEKDLLKCDKVDLLRMWEYWKRTSLVEVIDKDKANQLISECENCKRQLEKAQKKVLMSIDNDSKYHIQGVVIE